MNDKQRWPRTSAIVEAVSAADRQWFLDHPHATARIRAYVPGEFRRDGRAVVLPAGGSVLVTQIAPGARTRRYIAPPTGKPADAAWLYDLGTGEVLQELGAERWQ